MKSLLIGLVAALSLSPASGWQRDGSFVNELKELEKLISILGEEDEDV